MKKNIIISIVVIVLLAGYLVFNTLTTKTIKKLPAIKDPITELVLKKGESIIIIKKDGDSWKVNEFEGDKNVIANMENKIKDLKVTDLVSDKPHYERFELDSAHAIHVQAKSNGQTVRDFYIGKKGSTYRHTYVRFEGDPKVYLAEDTLDSYFNKTVDDLRNKDIVQIDIAKIELVKLWYKNATLTLQKTIVEKKKESSGQDKDKQGQIEKEEQWTCKEYPNVKLDNDKVKEILYTFDPLKAYSFPEIDAKSLTGKIASVSVTVKQDDNTKKSEEITLVIHKEFENNRYLCTSSKTKYVFTLDEWRAKRVFKTLQDLKK
ncbi:MAG: DUF4340 domain-containing protein [Spirochaetes bacterium]|nr:DUF4340 domain-containing protein [Spirochaetota bacterium]